MEYRARQYHRPLVHFAAHELTRLANGEMSCNSIQTTLCLLCANNFFLPSLFGELKFTRRILDSVQKLL